MVALPSFHESVRVSLCNDGQKCELASLCVCALLQDKRVFLAGDAAHRFPPAGAFGMNTGIQVQLCPPDWFVVDCCMGFEMPVSVFAFLHAELSCHQCWYLHLPGL